MHSKNIKEKETYIKKVAEKWKNKIVETVYNAMIMYQVEITD
jgi:replication initiation and membrane attachment protein DnaB